MSSIDRDQVELLIVDDTPANLDILSTMLMKNGFKVRQAENGPQALAAVQELHPDLILLDISMPEMSGYEVCEHLKADSATEAIPVIFISALNDTSNKIKAFEVGGVDYVSKPFRVQEVIARVEAQLTLYFQRQEIERLLEKERAYFEQLNSMKDELMHTTSHDLKNPINLVMGYTGLLAEQESVKADPEAVQFVAAIQRATNRMLSLVTDLLDLAQIETGLAMVRHDVDVSTFLQKCLSNYEFDAQNKNINLSIADNGDDLVIRADEARLTQVFNNLISNAIKYTPDGGTVTLRAVKSDATVDMQVNDTGFGIPENDIPHLFEKFYRVQEKLHSDIEGTGLGLAIVRAIVEQHNGSIWVESVLGQGSTFHVEIPIE